MAGEEMQAGAAVVRGKAVGVVPRSSSKKAKDEEGSADKADLQRAFERFRLSRMGSGAKSAKPVARDPAFKLALRQAFVEQAKKYLGVPYAKKYIDPSHPDYLAPLFLDCCALVRRAVNDLGDKFGFMLGAWNQNYQIDMLPDTGIKSHTELQPGDLIFYQGTYFDPNRRKQKHGMTHVEIWIGPGETSIGSRKSVGRVTIHDSYIFTSLSYHSTVHHFRSIEPWLDGVCVSYCPEHKWRRKGIPASSRSVFSSITNGESAKGKGKGKGRASGSSAAAKGGAQQPQQAQPQQPQPQQQQPQEEDEEEEPEQGEAQEA